MFFVKVYCVFICYKRAPGIFSSYFFFSFHFPPFVFFRFGSKWSGCSALSFLSLFTSKLWVDGFLVGFGGRIGSAGKGVGVGFCCICFVLVALFLTNVYFEPGGVLVKEAM